MVEQLSTDWNTFRAFAQRCEMEKTRGAEAARQHLGLDLGEYACALVQKEHSPAWSPDPRAIERQCLCGVPFAFS